MHFDYSFTTRREMTADEFWSPLICSWSIARRWCLRKCCAGLVSKQEALVEMVAVVVDGESWWLCSDIFTLCYMNLVWKGLGGAWCKGVAAWSIILRGHIYSFRLDESRVTYLVSGQWRLCYMLNEVSIWRCHLAWCKGVTVYSIIRGGFLSSICAIT